MEQFTNMLQILKQCIFLYFLFNRVNIFFQVLKSQICAATKNIELYTRIATCNASVAVYLCHYRF